MLQRNPARTETAAESSAPAPSPAPPSPRWSLRADGRRDAKVGPNREPEDTPGGAAPSSPARTS